MNPPGLYGIIERICGRGGRQVRILGIDPGYAIVGYGVIQAAGGSYRPVEYGAITTPAGADFGQRLLEIYQGMEELLRRLCPEAAAVENVPGQNMPTARPHSPTPTRPNTGELVRPMSR